jgi:hypothetical protein
MPRLSSCSLVSSLSWVFALLFVPACGSSDEGEDTNAEEESTSQNSDETETETETGDPVCFPAGIYGPCSGDNLGACQCLLGADIYQVCTAPCMEDSDCGDPADFPGATPTCLPVNPGAEQKTCSLACTSTSDCPCDLVCQPTTSICAENQ